MKTLLIPLLFAGVAIGCSGEFLTDDMSDGPGSTSLVGMVGMVGMVGGGANAVEYDAVGDCRALTIIDPGTVTVVDGIRLERGVTAECPLSGDVAGVIRFVRNSTLRNADAPFTEWEGPVWGQTFITVAELFGQTDLQGTFEGPFRTDWQNLLLGDVKLNRRGTGDFQGMTLIGTGTAAPGSFGRIILEKGVIQGR